MFVVVLVYGIYKGYAGDFFGNTLNIFKGVVAMILAMKVSYMFSGFFSTSSLIAAQYVPLFAFFLAFVVIFIGLRILSGLFEALTGSHYNNWMRFVGAFTWIFILGLGFSALLFFCETSDMITANLTATSVTYPYLEPIYPIVSCKMSYIWPAFEGMYDSFIGLLGNLGNSVKGQCF